MIRPELVKWHEVTLELLQLPDEMKEDDRDARIATITDLIEQRDALEPFLKEPFTSEEQALGQELLTLEPVLQQKLLTVMKRIRLDISETQHKKDHMKNYVNPYSRVARDGTFYDTKQ